MNDRDVMMALGRNAGDASKVALAFYVGGLTITVVYYVRFSILSLDLLRPQCIVVGSYFACLYIGFPTVVLLALRSVTRTLTATLLFGVALIAKDVAVAMLVGAADSFSIALLVVSQILCFATMPSTGSLIERIGGMQYRVVDASLRRIASLLLIAVVFATSVFGHIPGYLGGGRPLLVRVFTQPPELPANRTVQSTITAQVNPSIPCYRLALLYESSDYLYFVAQSHGATEGYAIMRLQRSKVLRMDYVTPVHFTFGGQV